MRVLIINGPNLNNIGIREPDIYGKINFSNYLVNLRNDFPDVVIEYYHSHSESDIVIALHNAANSADAVILNAGAYSHTSVAIRDAVAAIDLRVILVHISNVYAREKFRCVNLIAPVCDGIITGFGIDSYKLAIFSLK